MSDTSAPAARRAWPKDGGPGTPALDLTLADDEGRRCLVRVLAAGDEPLGPALLQASGLNVRESERGTAKESLAAGRTPIAASRPLRPTGPVPPGSGT